MRRLGALVAPAYVSKLNVAALSELARKKTLEL